MAKSSAINSPNTPKKRVRRKPTAGRGKPRLMQEDLYALVGKSDKEIADAIRQLTLKGRPPKALDPQRVLALRACGCSEAEIAADQRMDLTTFRAKVKADPFVRRMLGMGDDLGNAQLRSKQFQRAMAGSDCMLVWLGKNRLGQKDFPDNASASDRLMELMQVMRMAKAAATQAELDACEPAPMAAIEVSGTPVNGSGTNGSNGHA